MIRLIQACVLFAIGLDYTITSVAEIGAHFGLWNEPYFNWVKIAGSFMITGFTSFGWAKERFR
jgi:hypothetical protein